MPTHTPLNTDDNTRLKAAKEAYLAEGSSDTLLALLTLLSDAAVWVPARIPEDAASFTPLVLPAENGTAVLPCQCSLEDGDENRLPEGAVFVRTNFRALLDLAIEEGMGVILDPFNSPLTSFGNPEICREIREALYPAPAVHDIAEVIALKEQALQAQEKESYKAFLAALCRSKVYVPGLSVYSEEDSKLFCNKSVGDIIQTKDEVRFRMNTVVLNGDEYLTVYLCRAYLPDADGEPVPQVPENADPGSVIHHTIRRFDMAELVERYSHAKQMAGIVVDYQSPTGAVQLPVELLKIMTSVPQDGTHYEETEA